MSKKRRLILLLAASFFILLIPFVAMQFTDEVNWNSADFIIAGIMLLGLALLIEFLLRRLKKPIKPILVALLIILFLLLWAELAVGIFGTPLAGH